MKKISTRRAKLIMEADQALEDANRALHMAFINGDPDHIRLCERQYNYARHHLNDLAN